jgi:hypothetical protein
VDGGFKKIGSAGFGVNVQSVADAETALQGMILSDGLTPDSVERSPSVLTG